MAKISIKELFNMNIIQQIQDTFSSATGMASIITDTEGRIITEASGLKGFCRCVRSSETGLKRCDECDRIAALKIMKYGKPHIYKCHMGLYDFAAPIMVDDEFIGCIMGGQVMCEGFDEGVLRNVADEIGVNADALINESRIINLESISKVKNGAQCLYVLSNAISAMSYCNYQSMQKLAEAERNVHARSGFIVQNLLSELKSQMNDWMYREKEIFKNFDGSDIASTKKQLASEVDKVYFSLVKSAEQRREDTNYNVKFFEHKYNIKEITNIRVNVASDLCREKNIEFSAELNEDIPECFFGDCENNGYIIDVILTDMINCMDGGEIKLYITTEKNAYSDSLVFVLSSSGFHYSSERLNEIRNSLSGGYFESGNVKNVHKVDYSYVGFILRNMYGIVNVVSDEENGTVFTVKIPQLEVKESYDYE